MSELDNVTKLKHINSLAAQTASAINELLINGLSGVGDTADVFTGATSIAGGASGLVPAPAAGDKEKFLRGDGTWALPQTVAGGGSSDAIIGSTVLDTIPVTVNGGMWYEQLTTGLPVVYLHLNNRNYSFVTDEANFDGDPSQYLFSHLTFNSSTTADACNNLTWTATGTPTIGTANAIRGNALQLNGSSDVYTTTDKSFGGQDFTIDFYGTVTSMPSIPPPRMLFLMLNNSDSFVLTLENDANALVLGFNYNNTKLAKFQIEIGRRYHFAICYFQASQCIKFFIDGKLAVRFTLFVPATTIQTIVIGNWENHSSNTRFLTGAIDEFRIHNGVALWATDFTPPTAADYGLTA